MSSSPYQLALGQVSALAETGIWEGIEYVSNPMWYETKLLEPLMKHCPSLAYALTYTNSTILITGCRLTARPPTRALWSFTRYAKWKVARIWVSLISLHVCANIYKAPRDSPHLHLMAPGRAHHVPQRHSLATELVLQLHQGSWCWIQKK